MKIGRKDSARGCAMKARSTAAIARSAGYFTASLIRLCIAWATVQASQPLRASLFASEAPDDKHLLEAAERSEEPTSELQSLMRISYAVFCLKKKKNKTQQKRNQN